MPITSLDFITTGAPWPAPSEKPRIKKYAQNRELWRGNHDQIWGDWWRVLREDKQASLQLIFNWHRRLSTLWADLLVGEPPRFSDGTDTGKKEDPDSPQATERQKHVDRLAGKDDNSYVSTLHEVALDVSRYGDGLVKITLEEEGARIWAQPPHYWYPVVDPGNLRRFTHHVLAWNFEQNDMKFLWVEIHHKGAIERRVFHIEGNLLGREMPVAAFSTDPGNPVQPYEATNVDDFLVIPFTGLIASDEIHGNDDYTDLDSIVQALETRAGQINKVLDAHTEPNMYGPEDYIEEDSSGNPIFKSGKYIPVDGEDQTPGYLTWDGNLEAQFKELEWLIEQLYIMSDTSPAAFGKLESGLAESGSALKRLMQAPLAKVARIRLRFDPAAKKALKLAIELEAANGRPTPAIEKIHIEWQDGLPADPKESAETEEILVRSELTSHVSSIRRLHGGTESEAEDEYQRIQDEAQEKANSAFEIQKKEAALQGSEEGNTAQPGNRGKPGAVNSGSKSKAPSNAKKESTK